MPGSSSQQNHEKRSAALGSLVAAVVLTSLKIVVGALTGSLGILAEAAHSGLDLVAAFMTFLAVRISGRPPDTTHPYGHGKVENLSALFETLLLLATCVWVALEAIHRLRFHVGQIEVNGWSFAVMAVSIAIDFSRSRMLYRVAKKFNSQALEADALHFQTDIWSSSVVIVGLAAVKIAEWVPGVRWLLAGDAVAALGVSAIVVWVSVRLGRRTIEALLDTAPAGLEGRIAAAVSAVPGVRGCHHIRIRPSGPELFVDLHVEADGGLSLAAAHALTETIEAAIHGVAPDADVTVHPEPV
jgi:cation diffusion facilitator family transporter